MRHEHECCFGRVLLKPLSEEESEMMRLVRNRFSNWFGYSGHISKEQQVVWYEKYLQKQAEYMFSVFYKDTGKWIGAAGLYDVDYDLGVAEFGRIVIDPELRPETGLGKDTVICLCCFGFEVLGLQKIKLTVFSDNIPAMKSYLYCGFRPIYSEPINSSRENIFMEIRREEFAFKSKKG